MGADFSAVGLGTGPEGAISRNALNVLNAADEIYCPKSRNGSRSHARERLRTISDFSAQLIDYPLAMQEGGRTLRDDYREAARRIGTAVEDGQSVAAVTVGDPSLYSTLGPLVEAVDDVLPSESIRTIPGISSIQAAASALGRPLVQHDEQFGVIPLSESTNLGDGLFEQFETLAFTKVSRDLTRLLSRLEETGRSESSYLFERLGTDDETIRSVSELETPLDVPYFSLVLSFEGDNRWD